MTAIDPHRTIETVWRSESARIIAALTRIVRDVGLAEELAQDALVAGLEQWPRSGVPRNPGAWLMGTAKHRAIDELRRREMLGRKQGQLGYEIAKVHRERREEIDASAGDDVGDDLLRLLFTACHPVLSREAQVALTLRLLCGLTTQEIARAFLVPEPTIAQRIVRAKRTIAGAAVPFEVPRGDDRAARLSAVLDVLYVVFNEGYTATSGKAWVRHSLCEEAMRLGRVLAGLMPHEAEVHGLVALMELQGSRLRARLDSEGEALLLNDQNRSRWDRWLIRRGLAALARAERLGARQGSYTLQAGIAACHARADRPDRTDWARIVELYTALVQLSASPVAELNRAVAIGMVSGAGAALAAIDELALSPALRTYHYLASVRGHFLEQVGRLDEARAEFERAASLTGNAQEQALLVARSQRHSAIKN